MLLCFVIIVSLFLCASHPFTHFHFIKLHVFITIRDGRTLRYSYGWVSVDFFFWKNQTKFIDIRGILFTNLCGNEQFILLKLTSQPSSTQNIYLLNLLTGFLVFLWALTIFFNEQYRCYKCFNKQS